MEKLMKHDPIYHDAVTHGLCWDVVSSEVLDAFPELASLIQLTANTSGQLQRKEAELQPAKRIHACWGKKSKAISVAKFEDVKADLMRSKPACQESLANRFRFVMQYGGGQGCSFLNETIEVCSICPPKTLGNEFWSAILTHGRVLVSLQSFFFLRTFVCCHQVYLQFDEKYEQNLSGFDFHGNIKKSMTVATISSNPACVHSVCDARGVHFPG